MKKIVIIFFFMAVIATTAYGQSITGNWLLDIERTTLMMNEAAKVKFAELTEDQRAQIKNNFAQRTFGFGANGTFQATWYDGTSLQTSTGTWSQSGAVVTLVVSGRSVSYRVNEVTATRLLLEKESGPEGFFKVLAFNRQ